MVEYWEPGTSYGQGTIVEYNGHRYKIIQPHTSQSDWTPSATPALWGRMQDADHGYEQQQQQAHQPQFQPQSQQPYQQTPPQYTPPEKIQQAPEKADKPEDKKHRFDDDDKTKLKIGAGLAAGAALLAGGLFAYKEHDKHKNDEQIMQDWLGDAQYRTQQYRQFGPTGPTIWVLNRGKNIPEGAIVAGKENTWTLYIARACHKGSIQVGKASDVFQKGAVIGYGHDEIHLDTYEILLGDMHALRWVPARGKLDISALGYKPVEGGRDRDGTPLYIALAHHKGADHPGKASAKLDGAFIPYGGSEKEVKEYKVLCYNH
ncbi:carbohydrate-binding module family 12 protein [Cyathus striatus]|nr:carbohydrate-binding module family 12 protein [Cyathus striatus]